MKKKILIGLGALGVIVIAAALYVYMTFFYGTDFSKNVPKNAVLVMKVDLMGMGKKINMKEASESKAFRKEILENLKSGQKEMIEKVIENPTKSGLQLGSKPTLFLFNNSKSENEPVMGFIFGVADKKNLDKFLTEVAKDITIKEPDQDGYYKADLTSNESAVLYFNDKVGLILVDLDSKGLSLKRIRDEIVALDKDKSIETNETYMTFNKQTNDMMGYFNGTELLKIIEMKSGDAADPSLKSLKSMEYGMSLNFNEDEIAFKVMMGNNKAVEATNVFKEAGLSESELKNIDPKGNPLAYYTLNLDVKKTLKLITEQPGYEQNLAGIANQIENFAATVNIPMEDLKGMFDGKMSISFSGIKPGNNSDTSFVYQPTVPLINAWAHLGNKEAATKLLEYMVTSGTLVNKEGIYAENNFFGTPSYFITIKENDLFISTQEVDIQSKLKGEWSSLKESFGKQTVMTKPVNLFADYESMLKSQMSSNEQEMADKLKNVLSSFKSISMTGDKNEAVMIIKFTEKKTNSLQRIIDIAQEAYRILS